VGYTVKPGTDEVTALSFTRMTQESRVDDRAGATESKFYLPAGSPSSFVAGRLERVWAMLFPHGIETSE
jgi:hypothetical protein